MVVRTGNGANPPDKAGLADLVADMLDEGTATRSATAIAEEIAQLGATLLTNATWDASSLSVSALTENIDRHSTCGRTFCSSRLSPRRTLRAYARISFPPWPGARTRRPWLPA